MENFAMFSRDTRAQPLLLRQTRLLTCNITEKICEAKMFFITHRRVKNINELRNISFMHSTRFGEPLFARSKQKTWETRM